MEEEKEIKPVDTLTPYEAARIIGKNAEYIRAGLRANRFDFGSAVPPEEEGGKWNYNIIKSKFLEYAGIKKESDTSENKNSEQKEIKKINSNINIKYSINNFISNNDSTIYKLSRKISINLEISIISRYTSRGSRSNRILPKKLFR